MIRLVFLCSALVWMPLSVAQEAVSEQALLAEINTAVRAENEAKVVSGLQQYVKLKPNASRAWYMLGVYEFRLSHFQESVNAFDQYVELEPAEERKLWERGISHYYAGLYNEGAEQFALYQTYHDNDVENSVWRFLCMAKAETIAKAREQMLPIKNDPRVPLMEIYALFRGESTPQKVEQEILQGEPAESEKKSRRFYGDLYLSIYYETLGQKKLSEEYARKAWKEHEKTTSISRYMWQVARVHTLFCESRRKMREKMDEAENLMQK